MFKRVKSVLISLLAAVAVAAGCAFAVIGFTPAQIASAAEVTAGTELTSAGGKLAEGDYYLSADLTLNSALTVSSGAVTLELNGHVLQLAAKGEVIKVTGGTLTINDSLSETPHTGLNNPVTGGTQDVAGGVIYGKASNTKSLISVNKGTLILNGGTLFGNETTGSGGAVNVDGGGVLEMNGGAISANKAKKGGGVYVTGNGKFTLADGKITGNAATENGGGVTVTNSTFDMNGGEISGNKADVISSSGGKGGGVCVSEGGKVNISKGKITGNESVTNGGAVYATQGANAVTITGGEITGNKITGGDDNASGVFFNSSGTFTVSGDVNISGNTNKNNLSRDILIDSNLTTLKVGVLGENAVIGVYFKDGAATDPFTDGFKANNPTADPTKVFPSDNACMVDNPAGEPGRKPHAYVDESTTADCTKGGFVTHTCTECGHFYTEQYAPQTDHTPGNLTVSGEYEKTYNAFETFDSSNLVVNSSCKYCSVPLGTVTDFTVKYQNGDCLHVGDTHVIISSGEAETTAEINPVAPVSVEARWELRENGQWKPLTNAASLVYDGAGKRPDIAFVFAANASDKNSLIESGNYRIPADNTAYINVTKNDGEAYSIVDCGTYNLSVNESAFADYAFASDDKSVTLTVAPYETALVWQREVNGVFEDMTSGAEFTYSGTGRKGVVRVRFKAAANDATTGVSDGYYYIRATDGDRIGITLDGGEVENILNCGDYTLTFDTSAYKNYTFTGGNSFDFKLNPVTINLRDTDNFYWYLKNYNSALRTGYVDEDFKYYQHENEVPADKTATPVTRSIVRYRGVEVIIEIHTAVSVVPDGKTAKDVISVTYAQSCSGTDKGKYTAEAQLKIADELKGNYLFVKEGELEPNRHITATINADGSAVTIVKEWYIAEIDNGLRDQHAAAHGEWKIDGWTFGEDNTVYAPRLEHGDESVGTETIYVFTQNDNKVKFNLYKIGDDGVERISIGAHAADGGFNRYDFNRYINSTMPAGRYVLEAFVGSLVLTGDHVHWWNNESHTGAEGITLGSFSREFEFTVKAAALEVTDNLKNKRNEYTYDGNLHLYTENDKPVIKQPLYLEANARAGEWTNSAYNKYYAQPQITYNLERWGNNAYRTEAQLLENHSINQAPITSGNYHVRYKISAPNYEDYGGADYVFYVDITKVKVAVPATQTVTYTGDQFGFKLAAGAVYTVDSANSYVNAREYDIKLKLTDPDNYEWNTQGGVVTEGEKNETVTVKLVIEKAVFKLGDLTFTDKTVVYDGQHHTVTVNGNRPAGLSVEYENNDQINPGVYKAVAKFTVTGNAAANYEPIKNMEATLTIKRASLSGDTVIIESDEGFDPDITLEVVPVDESKFKDYKVSGTVEGAYTVKLTKGGVEVKPDGAITIKLLLPEAEHNYNVIHVYGGKTEKITHTVEDGYAKITASELADFVFAYDVDSTSGAGDADYVWLIATLSVLVAAEIVIIAVKLVHNKKSKKQREENAEAENN